MSGSGDVNLWVFLFCSHRSTTVHNSGGLVPGFGIKSIESTAYVPYCQLMLFASGLT